MADAFRPLTKNEREVLEWMLQPSFPGRDELRAQLEVATAREIDDDGCIALDCGAAAPAPLKFRIPTEGECALERASNAGEPHSRSSATCKARFSAWRAGGVSDPT